MNLILLADCLDRSQPLLRVVSKAGYRLLKLIGPEDEASRYVESLCPDAMIIVSDEIGRPVLREMRAVAEKRQTPILVFTRDSHPQSIV